MIEKNYNKEQHRVIVDGIKPFKPGILNKIKGGFIGFDKILPHGRHLYKGVSESGVYMHALTNFTSSIYQEYQSECKESVNTLICFDRNELNIALSCLSAAGLSDNILIHDLSDKYVLNENTHNVNIALDPEFITCLLFDKLETTDLVEQGFSSFQEAIGILALQNNYDSPERFCKTLKKLDHKRLVDRFFKTNAGIGFSEITKVGVINIFVCDESSVNNSSELAIMISKAIAKSSQKNNAKNRLLVSEVAKLSGKEDFFSELLSCKGICSALYKEIHVATMQPETLFLMATNDKSTDEDTCCTEENFISKYLLSQLGIDVIYTHIFEENSPPKFNSEHIINNKIISSTSLVSKSVYANVQSEIKYKIN